MKLSLHENCYSFEIVPSRMITGIDDLAYIFSNDALTLNAKNVDLLFIKGKLSLDYNLFSIPTHAPPKPVWWSGWPVLAHTC